MNSLEPHGKEECEKTLRQAMIDLLEDGPKSAKDLSQGLKVQEKLVYDHLVHIERSIKTKGQKLVILPATCSSCDYIFSDRKKFAKPSRCPECKRSHITAPAYEIKKS